MQEQKTVPQSMSAMFLVGLVPTITAITARIRLEAPITAPEVRLAVGAPVEDFLSICHTIRFPRQSS
jgi:hypothetical protein